MDLSPGQKAELRERGYVKLPDLVPRPLVQAALRAINASLGRGLPASEVEKFRAQTFCPELATSAVLLDLFGRSGASPLALSLLGRMETVTHAQVALGFPTEGARPTITPHLDGMYTPTNGVPRGSVLSFTALLGVLLSDLPEADAGNLVVWPGTHRRYEQYFRERGPQSLLAGMPKVDLPEPEAVTGRAGDVVLCHYQLAHTGGPNLSPHVRYAVYFRVKARGHDAQKWEALTDLWREWPGMGSHTHASDAGR